jgi:hypothetical protein
LAARVEFFKRWKLVDANGKDILHASAANKLSGAKKRGAQSTLRSSLDSFWRTRGTVCRSAADGDDDNGEQQAEDISEEEAMLRRKEKQFKLY